MHSNPEIAKTQRIKDLLCLWASLAIDKRHGGYPKQVAFATERVQDSNRSTDTYYESWPADIQRLNGFIEAMAPIFKQVLRLEYFDKRPQKTKADVLGIRREVFNQRMIYIHEQLDYSMFNVAQNIN